MYLAVSADHRVKMKEDEKFDKYLDFAKEVKKKNEEHEAFGTLPKNLEKKFDELEIKRRIETVQTTALLKSGWILGRVLQTWELAVTQTPMENYQLELVWKPLKK